jgi:hypothetical protein
VRTRSRELFPSSKVEYEVSWPRTVADTRLLSWSWPASQSVVEL